MTAPTEEVVDPDGLLGDPTGEPNDDGEGEGDGSATDSDAKKDWKAEFEAQQRINRDLERRNGRRLKELEGELAAARAAKSGEGEKKAALDIDALRKQIRDESRAEVLRERALDKIEAKAAGRFKDPEDALLRLGRNVDEFIDGDKIDLAAIEDALVELLDKRPDFGVTQGEPKRFKGTADGGAKGNAGKPQLTEADVKRLASQGKHAEINAAREAGQLNKLLGIT